VRDGSQEVANVELGRAALGATFIVLVAGVLGVAGLDRSTETEAQGNGGGRTAALETRVAGLELRVAALEPGTDGPSSKPTGSAAEGANASIFEGTTDTVTEPFVVREGVLRVDAVYRGDGNFIVQVYGPANSSDLVFNEIGPYQGQRAIEVGPSEGFTIGVREGEVFFEVIADGPWTITVAP
jgi:hypothetical protein